MGEVYSRVMGADPALMTIVVCSLPAGSIWLGRDPQATSAALLMCNARAGRDRATRHELAATLVGLVAEHTGVSEMNAKVEFTQHTGDEMHHPFLGGINHDWDTTEALPPTEHT